MVESRKILRNYFKLFFKQWYLLAFLLVDAVGLFIGLSPLEVELPTPVFWLLTVIAVFYAGFQVYSEVAPQDEGSAPIGLSMNLIEGNEYSYSLTPREPWEGEGVPHVTAAIHVKIVNPNSSPVTILKIDSIFLPNFHDDDTVFSTEFTFSTKDVVLPGNIEYPIEVDSGEPLIFDVTAQIRFRLTPTQFAARLGLLESRPHVQKFTLGVELLDLASELHVFNESFDISKMPIRDLFIELWREEEKDELVRLAAGR